jgi:hypothetical protein
MRFLAITCEKRHITGYSDIMRQVNEGRMEELK